MTHHSTLRRARTSSSRAPRVPNRLRLPHLARAGLLAAMIATAPAAVRAQVNEALTATRVNDFILLKRGANGALRVATVLSPGLARSHPLTDNALFSVTRSQGANILLDYLNPLLFTWSVDHKAQPEPLGESVQKFLATADQLFTLLNGKTATAESTPTVATGRTAGDPSSGTANVAPPPDTQGKADSTARSTVATYHDIALNEWALWMESGRECVSRKQAGWEQLQSIAPRIDALLLGSALPAPPAAITSAAQFRGELVASIGTLAAASSMAELRRALDSSAASAERLRRANGLLRELITALRTATSGVTVTNEGTTVCANLAAYTRGVMAGVAERAERVGVTRESVVKQFGEMLAAIKEQVDKSASHDDVFLIGHASPTAKARVHVTVTIAHRSITAHDDRIEVKSLGTITSNFQVMEHQSLVTELSAGVAYSAVAYPKFRTNQVGSEHFVADAGVDRPRMVAATMLNLIPNTGWSGFTRLVGQLGIGATTESPLLLAGGGLRLSHDRNLTLSFGAAFPFQKRLKTLKVGDPVAGDAALEQDVERALARRPAFYIGIQR
jgi:hypothetical protein